jgi:SagB-type dehydrogenase family enzyme
LNKLLKNNNISIKKIGDDFIKTITLLEPQLELDYTLMNSLVNRRSIRKISKSELSLQEISNIVWAACGETKKATKRSKNRRTIASACNSKKVSILVSLDSGVYRFDESNHQLKQINAIDIRNDLAKHPLLKNPPMGLIYVARKDSKSGIIKHDETMQALLVGTEIGSMSQNVYLYCASAQLNTVLVALYYREKLQKSICLPDNEDIIFTQVIG